MTTETRSLTDDSEPVLRSTDHLYCIVDGERLGTSSRFALTGVDEVEIGRGKRDAAIRRGSRLRIDRHDPWLSAIHARIVRDGLLWVIEDAGARNGVRVNGRRVSRTLIDARDLIELGRGLFAVRRDEPAAEPVLHRVTQPGAMVSVVPALCRRLDELGRIAPTSAPILLRGATGTGKDRLAALVHARSCRTGALVPVNCGALPATLVLSELFGYRKGAFSGAIESRPGLAAAADRGTLFLDEVAELPPPAQVALLRLLEQKELRPLGATLPSRVDLRVVAATHRDLSRLVATGEFREDLAARLCGFELVVPSLADRIVDLGIILGEHVPSRFRVSNAALRAIASHRWPRNVRELVRALEQAIALASGDTIELGDLPEPLRGADRDAAQPSAAATAPPEDDHARRTRLIELLEKHGGNVTRIAAEMGKARMQIQRWLDRYQLDPASYRH